MTIYKAANQNGNRIHHNKFINIRKPKMKPVKYIAYNTGNN